MKKPSKKTPLGTNRDLKMATQAREIVEPTLINEIPGF